MLWWLLVAQLAALVVTGIYLTARYQPTADQAWPGLDVGVAGPADLVRWARGLHRVAAPSTILTGLVLTGVAVARTARRLHGWGRAAAIGAGLGLALVAASLTGQLLPWDQLAMRAVTVGGGWAGYGWLFGDGADEVRFVLIGGAEVSVPTLRRWFVAHVVLGAAAVGIVVVWRRWQQSS